MTPSILPKVVSKWLKDNKVKVLEWTSQSPDLIPIEHLWVCCILSVLTSLLALQSFSSHHYNGGFDQKITKKEASLVLGISPTNTKSKVRDAHRRIMVLNHPGSPSVATSINAVTLGYVLGSGNTVSISFHVFG
uniref:J domain-containing protein n=1 Tax=Oncorhynchus mykiss TaxID=8022 RepID=A0A8C7P1G8_ONCMY